MRCTNNRLTRSQRRGSRYFGFYRTRTRFRILDYEYEYRFAEYRFAEYEYDEIRCDAGTCV
jgi:hypothetical protein